MLPEGVTPPVERDSTFRHLKKEEDDYHAERDACVETSGEDVVVAHPPPEVVAAHTPLEYEADNCPRREVDAIGRRHGANACEEHRDVYISPVRERVTASEVVEGDGEEGTDGKEPEQWAVHGTRSEQTVRADASPQE